MFECSMFEGVVLRIHVYGRGFVVCVCVVPSVSPVFDIKVGWLGARCLGGFGTVYVYSGNVGCVAKTALHKQLP